MRSKRGVQTWLFATLYNAVSICQTTLEFPFSSKHRLSAITMIPLFAIMVKTMVENHQYKRWNYHTIIFPNANMLVHSEQGLVFKHAKKKNNLKRTKSRPKTRLKHAMIKKKNNTKATRIPTHTPPNLKLTMSSMTERK